MSRDEYRQSPEGIAKRLVLRFMNNETKGLINRYRRLMLNIAKELRDAKKGGRK